MHKVEKWRNLLLKACGVKIARCFNYVGPFPNTMNVRVHNQRSCHIKSFFHHTDKSNLREISQTGPIPEIK